MWQNYGNYCPPLYQNIYRKQFILDMSVIVFNVDEVEDHVDDLETDEDEQEKLHKKKLLKAKVKVVLWVIGPM